MPQGCFRRIAVDCIPGINIGVIAQGHGAQQHFLLRVGSGKAREALFGKQRSAVMHCLDGHFIHGERAGFIRADAGDRPQCFYRREVPDQCVLPHHFLCAEGKRYCDNSRQGLRDGCHCKAHGSQKHKNQRLALKQAGCKNDGNNSQNDKRQLFAEQVQPVLQGGARHLLIFQHMGDSAQLGLHAGSHNDAASPAIGNCCSAVHHIGPVAKRQRFVAKRPNMFFSRYGFAGERRFCGPQLRAFIEAHIGRHNISSLQQHHISRHDTGSCNGCR